MIRPKNLNFEIFWRVACEMVGTSLRDSERTKQNKGISFKIILIIHCTYLILICGIIRKLITKKYKKILEKYNMLTYKNQKQRSNLFFGKFRLYLDCTDTQ